MYHEWKPVFVSPIIPRPLLWLVAYLGQISSNSQVYFAREVKLKTRTLHFLPPCFFGRTKIGAVHSVRH